MAQVVEAASVKNLDPDRITSQDEDRLSDGLGHNWLIGDYVG